MNELYQQFEQLRDIITGRKSYNSDDEWEDNMLEQLKTTDELVEKVMAEFHE